jgi:DNA replication protein DnaC
MSFKKPKDFADIIRELKEFNDNLPDMPCIKCGKIYKGEEKNFICSSCEEKERAIREENERRKKFIEFLIDESNIPRRYKNAKLSPKTEEQRVTINYLKKNFLEGNLEASSNILIIGSIGTGKTYISCAFGLEFMREKVKEVKYITEYQLLELYFQKNYQEFKIFRQSKLLILDELGKRKLAEWQRVQLEELLSYRYNELLPTILISNLTQSQFKEFVGERLSDRLKETNIKTFALNGESLRGSEILEKNL